MEADLGILSLYFFLERPAVLEEGSVLYGKSWEEQETRELACFVRRALEELRRREADRTGDGPMPVAASRESYGQGQVERVRITRGYRVFIGERELKIRPMAKSVLLLFLRHPEGIPLKCISDYREELAFYYRRVSRSMEPDTIERSICRILDVFSNDLNVNIARVNAALDTLVHQPLWYRIGGSSGCAKSILLDRSLVVWE